MPKLIVVGGGEFARVVIEAARAQGQWDVIGFVDPEPCQETVKRLGLPRLGDDSALQNLTDERLVLGIGTIAVDSRRARVVAKISAPERWTSVVHPFSSVSPTARVAAGAVILPGAVVCSGAQISEHAIVGLAAVIDHDVHIGKFVHIAPRAVVGGGATVEDHAYVAMGAVVRDHIAITSRTLVGMGAVVTKNFSAGTVLVGVPARPIG